MGVDGIVLAGTSGVGMCVKMEINSRKTTGIWRVVMSSRQAALW